MEDVTPHHQLQIPSLMTRAHQTQIADINKDAEVEHVKPLSVLLILNVVVVRDALIILAYRVAVDLQAVIADVNEPPHERKYTRKTHFITVRVSASTRGINLGL